jgi:hypothetical protein
MGKQELRQDMVIPDPGELADEIVEHDRHPKKRHHPVVRFLIVMLIYLFAISGGTFIMYYAWQRAISFMDYHHHLQKEHAINIERDKYVSDVERTLSMAYDHLTEWEVRYYTRILLDFSKEYNIPWEAYAALIRYESNWNPTLKSDTGAIGMIQIMPSTGKRMADQLGIRWKNDETLWNDLFNMVIGLTYFSESYKEAVGEGQTRSEALQHAMRHYVSGTGDPNKIKRKSKETQIYVREYRTSVWQECKKLMMFYKGVQAGEPDSLILEALGE